MRLSLFIIASCLSRDWGPPLALIIFYRRRLLCIPPMCPALYPLTLSSSTPAHSIIFIISRLSLLLLGTNLPLLSSLPGARLHTYCQYRGSVTCFVHVGILSACNGSAGIHQSAKSDRRSRHLDAALQEQWLLHIASQQDLSHGRAWRN